MITIKTGSYAMDETKVLAHLFDELQQALLEKYCASDAKCNICPYRHICEDIHMAKVFINDRANK